MITSDLDEALKHLRPVIGETADALWLAALLEPNSFKDIHAVARALCADLLGETYASKGVLLPPPEEVDARGEHPLGWVIYAGKSRCSFGLRDDELTQHVAILGRSGAGKSNVAYLLAWNLLRRRKPFLVLDWRRNYAHLASLREGDSLLVVGSDTGKPIAFNPLLPSPFLSAASSEAYIRELLSVVCRAYLPGAHLLSTRGVEHLITKGFHQVQERREKPTTFNDIRGWLEAYKARSREADWKVSAQAVLSHLTTGPLGQIFNANPHATLSEFLDQPVVFQLDALGSHADRAAFVNALLLWLYYHRLAEGRASQCKHVLIIEEAHHCFLKQQNTEHPLPDLMLRQMRDLGQALVLIDQNPSLLSVPTLGNTATTICLNLKHADDVEAAGRALTLPEEERHYIGRLQVGEAIVKLPRAHSAPFVVRFPRFPKCEALVPVPGKTSRFRRDSLKGRVEELRQLLSEAIRAFREADRTQEEEGQISSEQLSLLVDIARHPIAPVTERYKRLGWSAHRGTQVKRSLLENGLVREERVRTPEGLVALLGMTREARELLKSHGVEAKALPKNASLEHEYWKHRIAADCRRRGYHVEEEVHIGGGRTVDLVASKNGEKIAIEIETGKSDETVNQMKCVQAGFRRILIVRPFQATPARRQKHETQCTKHPD